jgi:hypothetical protein
MAALEYRCFHCGQINSYIIPLGRKEECSRCHSDAHVCKNCEHFDAKVYNECRETQADFIAEKERANFCDFLKASLGHGASAEQKKTDLRAAAEALFKKR